LSEKLTKLIIDGSTGKVEERELTAKEMSELTQLANETEQLQAAQLAKITARDSALAKLAALGLTEAEIAAL
jgi:DNA-binding NarL/FixJ family response regulator